MRRKSTSVQWRTDESFYNQMNREKKKLIKRLGIKKMTTTDFTKIIGSVKLELNLKDAFKKKK